MISAHLHPQQGAYLALGDKINILTTLHTQPTTRENVIITKSTESTETQNDMAYIFKLSLFIL